MLHMLKIIDLLLRNVRIEMVEIALLEKETKVLDVCCGTGDQANYYAQKSNYVWGIDIDTVEKDGNPKIILADAQKMPFKDEYFDVTSICLALHEKDQKLRECIIKEMERVTKKSGKIIIADYIVPPPKNLTSFIIKTIEFLAGKEHFKNFTDYIERGGLDNIIKKKKKERFIVLNDNIEISVYLLN